MVILKFIANVNMIKNNEKIKIEIKKSIYKTWNYINRAMLQKFACIIRIKKN